MVRWFKIMTIPALLLGLAVIPGGPTKASASDFIIYSVYRALDMGNPGEKPQKDFYINMGTSQGIREGSLLDVVRKISTFDLTSQKLYKDVSFPIGKLKVIHAESDAAIARLEKLTPEEITPAISPRAIMVGDLVRPTR